MKQDDTIQIGLVGSASGWGAQIRETETGPLVLHERNLTDVLQGSHVSSYWTAMIHPSKKASELEVPLGPQTLPLIVPHLQNLATCIESLIQKGEFPCALGGDHVMAVGTFSGAIKALEAQENFGLIWIDAHMDSHTPETSPSNAYHGMPLASLLGYGDPQLVNLCQQGAKIRPQDLCLIGIRTFEPEEEALLKKMKVKVFYCEEVKERGFDIVIQEALEHVSKNTKAFGVSIDLDAFDPKFAPGVGSPEENGMDPTETLPHLQHIRNHGAFAALEVTEFNPDLDQDGLTATLVEDILKEILPR